MSEQTIHNGIFKVASQGKTTAYFVEHLGAPQDVLAMLYTVDLDIHRLPEGQPADAHRFLARFDKMLPDKPASRVRMFEPLSQPEYEAQAAKLKAGDKSLAQYTVDYDRNQFHIASWDNDFLKELSAPLAQVIHAYKKAMRFEDLVHYRLDGHALASGMQEIADVQTIQEGPSGDLEEQSGQGLSML